MEEVRDGERKYLSVTMDELQSITLLKLIKKADLDGLLTVYDSYIDDTCRLEYNVTGLISLYDRFRGECFGIEEIQNVFVKILTLLQKFREYMILESEVVLHPRYLYIDKEHDELMAAVIPCRQDCMQEELSRIVELFMDRMDTENRELVIFIYGLYQICRKGEMTLSALSEYITPEKEILQPAHSGIPARDEQVVEEKESGLFMHIRRYFRKKMKGEDVVDFSDETMILTEDNRFLLMPLEEVMGTGKRIAIDHYPFQIGSDQERVDGYLSEKGISRIHGGFEWGVTGLSYQDFGSTNGSHLNDEKLVPNEAYPVKRGDIIKLAAFTYQVV